MELTQNNIDLISRLIKSNRKYVNNEDLYEDFFNETCERSAKIFGVIEAEDTLEAYIRKIASTAIITVLKDNGRLRRTSDGYVANVEIPLEEVSTEPDYSNAIINYSDIKIPKGPEDVAIQKDFLSQIASLIIKLDKKEPEKKYLHIYTLRYDKGMTQHEISEEVGISQSEVSKRLYTLMDNIKNSID